MRLQIETSLDYRYAAPTDVLLAIEVAQSPGQILESDRLDIAGVGPLKPVPGECGLGQRTWTCAEGLMSVRYAATVEVTRSVPDLAALAWVPPPEVPGEAVQFLWPSRYCQADRMRAFVAKTFGRTPGGAMIAEMAAWIYDKVDYVAGTSDGTTSAVDTFLKRQGICRDYAHLMLSFARAADIPARMAAVYGPDVDPPDFHAVAEVWLACPEGDGAWHMVDATAMAQADALARIAVGRDATDISFMTSFGGAKIEAQKVRVARLD